MDARIPDIVARMHVARITGQQLAAESGYNACYVSEVLGGKRGTEKTVDKLEEALIRLEQRQAEALEQAAEPTQGEG